MLEHGGSLARGSVAPHLCKTKGPKSTRPTVGVALFYPAEFLGYLNRRGQYIVAIVGWCAVKVSCVVSCDHDGELPITLLLLQ